MNNWNKVLLTDSLVRRMWDTGMTHEDIISALVEERSRLLSTIQKLDSIAPKKITCQDGVVRIWRCPDELVPEHGTFS